VTAHPTRRFYDTVADSYAALLPDTSFESPLDLAVLAEFERRVAAGAASGTADAATPRVLDAGCGTGRVVSRLLDHR
jgi:SAM-dependent methyltransferase